MSSRLSHRQRSSRTKVLPFCLLLRPVETTRDTTLQHTGKTGLDPDMLFWKGVTSDQRQPIINTRFPTVRCTSGEKWYIYFPSPKIIFTWLSLIKLVTETFYKISWCDTGSCCRQLHRLKCEWISCMRHSSKNTPDSVLIILLLTLKKGTRLPSLKTRFPPMKNGSVTKLSLQALSSFSRESWAQEKRNRWKCSGD